MSQNILELRHISKEFPGVKALKDVSFSLEEGEVHALVGENGAGKSTLIKVLAGVHMPTEGEVIYCGKIYDGFGPKQARELGIGIMHQELNLVNELTVMENMFLGELPRKGGIILDKKYMRKKSREILDELEIDIRPDDLVGELTVGYQQMVELARIMLENAKLLILDEPTAPLTNKEVDTLFRFITQAKEKGITIVYISHRLDEIFQITDRITVLRDGEYVITKNTKDTNRNELIKYMVGREVQNLYEDRTPPADTEIILETKNLTGNGVEGVTMQLRRGEILGLGGLIGAGRTEFVELLYGAKKIISGEIKFKGEVFHTKHFNVALSRGIAFVPEDRKQQGVLLGMSVRENISMSILRRISKKFVVDSKKELALVNEYKDKMKIKTPSLEQLAKNLSGGNQQKVVLAKGLASEPEIIIIDEPTRGIDVAARQEIYQLMDEIVARGKAIIMISSDMEELLGMADRILVFAGGSIKGEIMRDEFDAEKVLQYASIEKEREESHG